MLKSMLLLVVLCLLAGCGRAEVNPVRAVPRMLALPNSESLPPKARGARVYEVGQAVPATELTYVVHNCKWVSDGLAVIEWSVTNEGTMPVKPPGIAIASMDGLLSAAYAEIDSKSEFNHSEWLNPKLSRSGKSYFELPKVGKYIVIVQSALNDNVSCIDCPLSEPAYEVIQ